MENKTFIVSFKGRVLGAIGIIHKINTTIELPASSTKDEIHIKLHDKYEHITELKII